MLKCLALTCLLAVCPQINANALELQADPQLPARTWTDVAQYSPSEMKRIRRAIVAFQIELKRIGYYKGPIDGLYGRGTNAAWVRFARENGLSTKNLGNYEYEVLRSYGRRKPKKKIQKKPTANPMYLLNRASDLAENILGKEYRFYIYDYITKICGVNVTKNDYNEYIQILKKIQAKKLICKNVKVYQKEILQKYLPKSFGTQISIEKTGGLNGRSEPSYCFMVQGSIQTGLTKHFTALSRASIKKRIFIIQPDTLCLNFSGGDIFEALHFMEASLSYDTFYSTYQTLVKPGDTCGDGCSLIFLAGHSVEEYTRAARYLSKTGKLTFSKFSPILGDGELDKTAFQEAFAKVARLNARLQKLSEAVFSERSRADIRLNYILPPSLLQKINALEEGDTFVMPTEPLQTIDGYKGLNEYGIAIIN